MALSGSVLASAIISAVQAIEGFPDANDSPLFTDTRVLTAVCTAICQHIEANGVVNTGIPVQVNVISGTGATTAPGSIS